MSFLRLLFFLPLCLRICDALDSITTTNFINDSGSIVSDNGTFKLSFFSPPNSTNRYVGIYYNKLPVIHVIWVANRNNPLTDSSGSIQISEGGNVQVVNGQKHILWSSNITQVATNSTKAQLLDSGNLVLLAPNNTIIWQSFDHPSDTILPHMTLIHHKDTRENAVVRSWKSPSDPSDGRFFLDFGPTILPELYIWDNDRRHFRGGPWNGNMFIGIQVNFPDFQSLSIQNDGQGNITAEYSHPVFPLSNYEISYQGTLLQQYWDDSNTKGDWKVLFQAPDNDCDFYGKCGAFGSCNSKNSPICKCLKGFEPKDKEEWKKGNWSSGCTRMKQLLCGIEGAKEDGFLRLRQMKVPADNNWLQGLDQDTCRSQCLANCTCSAYAYTTGVGCMSWTGTLIDIQQFSTTGVDLYLRLPHSELGNSKKIKIIVGVTVASGIATLVAIGYFYYYRRKAKRERNKTLLDILEGDNRFEELPLFKFGEIAVATNNFQESNKLGQGGFGPVYRGTLENKLEVAVKRLSGTSRQGVEEFMNEVLVISKLQHRNLVKLLGCCVEGQERLLIYEYLPNKSLDAFLFDPQKKGILDWKKRFNIIEGICRGLLYLHRDSRLKIIHRDLKASNILLDEKLNPKISDFGMARIFGGDQNQADTTRVAGTYSQIHSLIT
ncbi:G-type lectin S-receptor-like serine/threonine-protein kinase SD1-13 isoform X2 [Silene latifolia]|uniref:G-type lectin S-receptor-like serine/threonine-protein kinase SD1-13 isoform X2 n=1 Tax=Silene latifolia TaxID=37657 RepID=UPI003D787BC4